MVTEARWHLHLRKMAHQKLGLDLIDQFQKAMIWEAFVKKIMVSFVLLTYFASSASADDIEKLVTNELFEVASKESQSSPLILFVKDVEKSMVGNGEAYSAFKAKLDHLPRNVVVIAAHTQTSSQKEKSHPGGLLFTKFGSNQTALLDLAFPDSFGRLHYRRSKETPKTTKQLTHLFPNKMTIQIPQDEALLSDWKQQLDRDTKTLKSESNIISILSRPDNAGAMWTATCQY